MQLIFAYKIGCIRGSSEIPLLSLLGIVCVCGRVARRGLGCDWENVTTQAAEVKFKSTRIHFIDFIISLLWYGG